MDPAARTIIVPIAARLFLAVARGERPSPAEIWPLREWWPVDGLLVVLTTGAGSVCWATRETSLQRSTSPRQGGLLDRMWVRHTRALWWIAALTVGRLGTATERLDSPSGRAAHPRRDPGGSSEQVGAAAAEPDESGGLGMETWAWDPAAACRTAPASGGGSAPSTDRSRGGRPRVEQSVAAFERYGRPYEAARSRARLRARPAGRR